MFPVPYLYRTAHNGAIDRYRRLKRRPLLLPLVGEIADEGAYSFHTAAEANEEDERLAVVYACIASLKSPHREVYSHYYLDGLSVEEVAATVQLSHEQVRGVLKSAREQIGRLLVPHLLGTALEQLSAADRALLAPHYGPSQQRAVGNGEAFVQARWRLIERLLRWGIIFQRLPPEEHCALATFVRERDYPRAAAAVSALRQARGDEAACTDGEAIALVAKAGSWLDRRLRAAQRT